MQQQQFQQKIQSQANPYNAIGFGTVIQEKQISQYKYLTDDVIGKGEFSTVYKGLNTETKEVVAIKVISIQLINTNSIYKQLLDNEMNILNKLDCKSILKLENIINTINNIYLITEHCSDGDLQNIIVKTTRIPEHNALKILKHLIKALLYLKEKNIIHRDIKASNILVSNRIPKLADFGFAINYSNIVNEKKLLIGTPIYMSPEIYYNQEYSFQSDLWALGCVFYEMLYGVPPFPAKSREELADMFRFHQQNQWLKLEGITSQAKDFIQNILAYNVKDRFDIYQAANHPLIQQKHPHEKKQK